MKFKIGPMGVKKTMVQNSKKQFYDTDYPHEFPSGNYYTEVYSCLPFYCECKPKYNLNVVDYFYENGYNVVWNFKRITGEGTPQPVTIVLDKDGTVAHIRYKGYSSRENRPVNLDDYYSSPLEVTPEPEYANINFLYTDEEDLIKISEGIKKYIIKDKSRSKISLLTANRGGMDTIEQELKHVEVDIPLHYGEKFVPVHFKIIEKLNEDKGKGLVLLHGLPGTGKTNYIRHLCSILKKEVIFLPPFMAENIAGPEFITFLLDHTNSILVIEDAEKVVLDREGENSNRQSVANLLNITDGILSDCLSIQVIATFNTSRDKIDKALLRKGRLIAEWKFDALSVEDSNSLFEHLGKEPIAKKPMTLTEIYNSDEEEFVTQQERRTIGFGN